MSSVYRLLVSSIAIAMQTVLNLELLCLGIILIVFLGKKALHLADVLLAPELTSKHRPVEGLVVYFLYFEFIVLIVKYSQSRFHFLLRYLVYIGIAAIVCLTIIDHESSMAMLVYSTAILIPAIMLWPCNPNRLKHE